MRPNGDPVQVLYVAGWIYSGSTLLANILGELDGVVAACEVRRIWRLGLLDDRPCGCGAAFSACPFWQAVMAEAFGGADGRRRACGHGRRAARAEPALPTAPPRRARGRA